MNRPYIVCHMVQSVDGRIDCDMVDKISDNEYYTALYSFSCTALVEGKHSYQIHYCGFEGFKPSKSGGVTGDTFYVAGKSEKYTVSVDNQGSLLWGKTENAGRVCILSRRTSSEYLDYLRNLGISYIVAGKDEIDLAAAMSVLKEQFGVERLAVVGGGRINGGFLAAGLIDELSIMSAPGIDGRTGQPSLFDGIFDRDGYVPFKMKLKSVEILHNDVIWARYTFDKQ